MGRGLPPEPSATVHAKTLLDGTVVLAVLPRRPDERPGDDRQCDDADAGNQYPEKRAHVDSLGSRRQSARLGQCSGMTPDAKETRA
jgi:hypothetical protein